MKEEGIGRERRKELFISIRLARRWEGQYIPVCAVHVCVITTSIWS